MRTPVRWQVTGVVGISLLGMPLTRRLGTGLPPPPLRFDPAPVRFPHSPSQGALHEAAFWRVRAIQLANDECDDARAALSAWDPAAAFDQKGFRRQFLMGDSAGYLRRARAAAQRAAALARTPREWCRAARELAQEQDALGFSASV